MHQSELFRTLYDKYAWLASRSLIFRKNSLIFPERGILNCELMFNRVNSRQGVSWSIRPCTRYDSSVVLNSAKKISFTWEWSLPDKHSNVTAYATANSKENWNFFNDSVLQRHSVAIKYYFYSKVSPLFILDYSLWLYHTTSRCIMHQRISVFGIARISDFLSFLQFRENCSLFSLFQPITGRLACVCVRKNRNY